MYSLAINKARVRAANKVFQKQHPDYQLTYHSIEQIEEWNAHLETIRGRDGLFTRELTLEEDRWVTNERMLCKIDHRYGLTRYCFIKNRKNKIVRFVPNIAQNIALDVLSEMEEAGVELILQFLKARRLGISTLFQLLVTLRLLFTRNISAIVGASNPEDSDKLSKMCLLAIERFPFWLRPLCGHLGDSVGKYKRGLFYEFQFSLEEHAAVNRLDIEHGTQFADMGRGENPSCVHLAEMAKYDNPESLVDAGLMRAMIPSSQNLACYEGTAEGETGWWPDKYEFNKKNYGVPGSGARMRPTFLPWFVGRDIYPSATDLITQGWNKIKNTWEPAEKTLAHARQAERFVQSNDLLRKHLGADWKMPREQMFFFEFSIKEYKQNKKLHIWAREMAADDKSCFVGGYRSVFDAELLMSYRDATQPPKAVFGLRGKCGKDEIVPKRYHPVGIDHNLKSQRVVADWTRHYAPFEFEFYPLKFKGYNEFDESGKILIWEWPKHGETYSISADNSDGLGEDNSVIQVMRKGGMGRCDSQACEFATGDVSGVELWPWVMALGALYSVRRDGKTRKPLLIPETNREGGNQLIKELELRGWKLSEMYSEYRSKSTSRGQSSITYGWHMSPQNRDDLILRGSAAIENEIIEINSPELVNEMSSFIRHENGKKAAAKHRKDDRVISIFLAFHALYHEEARATGKDPVIERMRERPEEDFFPLASDELAGSSVSAYINQVVQEIEYPVF